MIANAISIPDQKDQEKKYKILKQIIQGSHVVNLVIKKIPSAAADGNG
jgi:hypothetical protein